MCSSDLSGGETFEEYLKNYRHGLMILNVKSERIEHKVLELIKKYEIKEYFFLDSSFPMIYLLSSTGEKRVAVRFSEFEGIDTLEKMSGKCQYAWVDCFTKFPLDSSTFQELKKLGYLLAFVSPELQGRDQDIENYAQIMRDESISFDYICTKSYNISRWKSALALQ